MSPSDSPPPNFAKISEPDISEHDASMNSQVPVRLPETISDATPQSNTKRLLTPIPLPDADISEDFPPQLNFLSKTTVSSGDSSQQCVRLQSHSEQVDSSDTPADYHNPQDHLSSQSQPSPLLSTLSFLGDNVVTVTPLVDLSSESESQPQPNLLSPLTAAVRSDPSGSEDFNNSTPISQAEVYVQPAVTEQRVSCDTTSEQPLSSPSDSKNVLSQAQPLPEPIAILQTDSDMVASADSSSEFLHQQLPNHVPSTSSGPSTSMSLSGDQNVSPQQLQQVLTPASCALPSPIPILNNDSDIVVPTDPSSESVHPPPSNHIPSTTSGPLISSSDQHVSTQQLQPAPPVPIPVSLASVDIEMDQVMGLDSESERNPNPSPPLRIVTTLSAGSSVMRTASDSKSDSCTSASEPSPGISRRHEPLISLPELPDITVVPPNESSDVLPQSDNSQLQGIALPTLLFVPPAATPSLHDGSLKPKAESRRTTVVQPIQDTSPSAKQPEVQLQPDISNNATPQPEASTIPRKVVPLRPQVATLSPLVLTPRDNLDNSFVSPLGPCFPPQTLVQSPAQSHWQVPVLPTLPDASNPFDQSLRSTTFFAPEVQQQQLAEVATSQSFLPPLPHDFFTKQYVRVIEPVPPIPPMIVERQESFPSWFDVDFRLWKEMYASDETLGSQHGIFKVHTKAAARHNRRRNDKLRKMFGGRKFRNEPEVFSKQMCSSTISVHIKTWESPEPYNVFKLKVRWPTLQSNTSSMSSMSSISSLETYKQEGLHRAKKHRIDDEGDTVLVDVPAAKRPKKVRFDTFVEEFNPLSCFKSRKKRRHDEEGETENVYPLASAMKKHKTASADESPSRRPILVSKAPASDLTSTNRGQSCRRNPPPTIDRRLKSRTVWKTLTNVIRSFWN
ncbi:hypothetical protein BDQ17DRAFT_1358606 [Cyathus striatus]|nr:hypothetical protein BDQ17DRAFT_1358606 [Cyathus striatus]